MPTDSHCQDLPNPCRDHIPAGATAQIMEQPVNPGFFTRSRPSLSKLPDRLPFAVEDRRRRHSSPIDLGPDGHPSLL